MKEKWTIKNFSQTQMDKLIKLQEDEALKGELKDPRNQFILKYLVVNGYDTTDKINKLLYFTKKDLPDIRLAYDVDKFLNRLLLAIQDDEEITLLADYDADGINSAAVFLATLRLIGVKVNCIIPHRLKEGYGISEKCVKRLIEEYPNTSLIVTVDNGIVGFEGVEYAKNKGIDVIISDHHDPRPDGSLPNATAVVDVKRIGDKYPFKDLCGAGLIYRLMCEFLKEIGYTPETINFTLAYVACATIGDVVSLIEENRYFVKEGLKQIESGRILCFSILNKILKIREINEEVVGYQYVPIFNAIGRLKGDVIPAVDFLLETDKSKSYQMAEGLIAINEERKAVCLKEEKITNVEVDKYKDDSFIIIYDESLLEGTIGILAGRIKEKYGKPVIVFTNSEDSNILKGSGRSIPGFDIKKALDKCEKLLVGYGGHTLAAGLSIKKDKLEDLREILCQLATDKTFNEAKEEEHVRIDIVLKEEELNARFINSLNKILRPYGAGFSNPIIGLRDFKANSALGMPVKVPDDEKQHLKLSGNKVDVLWFKGYQEWLKDGQPTNIKCIGIPTLKNDYGKAKIQFVVNNNRLKAQ